MEDRIQPLVTVLRPLSSATYGSTVEVEGIVSDDATGAGDGFGSVKSIAYDVSNDDFRWGRITIDSDGAAVADPAGRPISWDKATNVFRFEFSTVDPNLLTGLLSISVEVTDQNGNVTTVKTDLAESQGPRVVLVEPGTTTPLTYKEGLTRIQLRGTACNSIRESTSASEVAAISWSVVGKIWKGALDLRPGSLDYDTASGTYLAANSGFYVNEDFTFDPLSREFATGFDVPYGAGSLLPIEIVAEDYNGHRTTASVILYADVAGPQITLVSPVPGETLYYSWDHFEPLRIAGNVLDYYTVKQMTYKVQAAGFSPAPVQVSLTGPGFGTFGVDGNFWFDLDDPTVALTGVAGPVTVTITAVNLEDNVSRPVFPMYLDNTAPLVGSVAFAASPYTSFAKVGDTVTLNFSVTETGSGLQGKPTVWIASHLLPDAQVVALGNDNYRSEYVMQAGDGTDAIIPFSIEAIDKIGNQPSAPFDQADILPTKITFFEGLPQLAPNSVGILSSNPRNSSYAKTGDTITLSFTSLRTLLGEPQVTIAGQPASVNGAGQPAYSATRLVQAGDPQGTVGFAIDFTDAAGNVGTTVTSITTGSNVTLDNTAPGSSAAPTAVAGPWINAGEKAAGVVVVAGLGGSNAVAGDELELLLGGGSFPVPLRRVLTAGDITAGSYSFTVASSQWGAEGSKSVSSRVTDIAGNVGASSSALALELDNTAPAVSLSDDHADGVVRNADMVTITASFTEANGISESPGPTISIAGGGVSGQAMIKVDDLHWSYVWDVPAGDGAVTVSVSAADAAGNPNAAATGQTAYTLDNTAPAVSLSDDHADGVVRNADMVTITASFTEANGISESPGPTISIAGGGVSGQAMVKVDDLHWSYVWDVPAGDGAATVSISASDAAGNPNAAATGQTAYTLDNTAPGAPAAPTAAAGPWINALEKAAGVVVVAGLGGSSAVTGDELELLRGGGSFPLPLRRVLTAGDITAGSYSFTVASSQWGAEGAKSVSSRVTDIAGNVGASSSTLALAMDSVAPTIQSVELSPSPEDRYATVTFSEGVYGDDASSTAVVKADLTVSEDSDDADITGWDLNPAHTPGDSEVVLDLTWSVDPETGAQVSVEASGADRIFDEAGNAMLAGLPVGGICHSISAGSPGKLLSVPKTASTWPPAVAAKTAPRVAARLLGQYSNALSFPQAIDSAGASSGIAFSPREARVLSAAARPEVSTGKTRALPKAQETPSEKGSSVVGAAVQEDTSLLPTAGPLPEKPLGVITAQTIPVAAPAAAVQAEDEAARETAPRVDLSVLLFLGAAAGIGLLRLIALLLGSRSASRR